MRKIVCAFLLLVAALIPSAAQQTKSQLNTEVNTNFPNNTTGLITPAILRQTINDIIASFQQAPVAITRASSGDTILLSDFGQLLAYTASPASVTLPQATGSFANFNVFVKSAGGGTVTVTPTVSTIDGNPNLAVGTGNGAWIVAAGGNYTSYTSGTSGGGGGGGVTQFNGLIGAVTTNVVLQKFQANGTYTPTSGMLHAIIECIGSGGGGGGAAGSAGGIFIGSGGSSGSYSMKRVAASDIVGTATITIGAVGSGGAAGANNGTAGAAVTVVSNAVTLCSGTGGPGGLFGSGGQVGQSGGAAAAGTGDVAAAGNAPLGGYFNSTNLTTVMPAGGGASSALGGGAPPQFCTGGTTSAGAAGAAYGGGGGGGCASNTGATAAGGDGSPGIVIITEFINM